MSYNPNQPMNDMLRRAGNRSRAIPNTQMPLPNIGQTPAVQAANLVGTTQAAQAAQAQMAQQTNQQAYGGAPQPAAPQAPQSPTGMVAPNVQPSAFTMSPAGSPADPNHYNYEPQDDGAWRVYPPGVPAPSHLSQASLPRAASTADYRRMRQAFQQVPVQTPAPPPNALA